MTRILLLEDDPSTLLYMNVIIKQSDFEGEVVSFENGTDCLTYLKEMPLNDQTLFLCDMNLPDMSALDILDQLVELSQSDVQMVIISSFFSEKHREEAFTRKEIIKLEEKPFSIPTLNIILNSIPYEEK